MSTTVKIARYELRDVIRSRWLIGYGLFFLLASDALLRFSDEPSKALLSIANVVLLIIPLANIVFATMHVYNAREFTELLLAQPVGRRQLFGGMYLGLTAPLAAAFTIGVGAPCLLHGALGGATAGTVATLLAVGVALTFAFVAIAFVIALRFEDRAKGLGVAIALWLLAGVVYDAGVLFAATAFADYPLERPMLGLMLANPIDLARVVLLLRFDVSALMGYTGAVLKSFFGSAGGFAIAAAALAAWVGVPMLAGARAFARKDF